MRYIQLDYAIIRIHIPVRGLSNGLLAYHEQEFKYEYEPVRIGLQLVFINYDGSYMVWFLIL